MSSTLHVTQDFSHILPVIFCRCFSLLTPYLERDLYSVYICIKQVPFIHVFQTSSVIRQKRSLQIWQVDKICCCLMLTSTYLKKVHLDVVDFKKKRAEERAKESQNAKEKNYEDYAWKDLCQDSTKLKNSECQS